MAEPKRADLMLACMPRSGSTMLACVLDMRPEQVVLLEPCRDGQSTLDADATAAVRQARRWGCKEVAARNIETACQAFRPAELICLVRDLRQVAASMHEWIIGHGHPSGMIPATATDLILRTAALIRELAAVHEVWWYEQLVTEPERHCARLASLGWQLGPLDYTAPCWASRRWEAERHGKAFSPASLTLRRWQDNDAMRQYIASLLVTKTAQRYQGCFGYPRGLDA